MSATCEQLACCGADNFGYVTESMLGVLVRTAASPFGWGAVTPSQRYDLGDAVTVTAIPETGYVFVQWENEAGDALATTDSYSFTALTDINLTAVFEEQ